MGGVFKGSKVFMREWSKKVKAKAEKVHAEGLAASETADATNTK